MNVLILQKLSPKVQHLVYHIKQEAKGGVSTVWLHGSDLGDDGVKVVTETVECNRIVKSLFLGQCNFHSEGCKWLAILLKNNKYIIDLQLSWLGGGNDIGPEGARLIGEGLKENESLQTLIMSACNIGDMGVLGLVEPMSFNRALRVLDLSNNGLTDESAESLALILRRNRTLQELNLSGNQITKVGAKALATGLHFNLGLRALWLAGNKLGDVGAKRFAEALVMNFSLRMLSLYLTGLNDEGVMEFISVLKRKNKSLQDLRVDGNSISKPVLKRLKEALQPNIERSVGIDEEDQGEGLSKRKWLEKYESILNPDAVLDPNMSTKKIIAQIENPDGESDDLDPSAGSDSEAEREANETAPAVSFPVVPRRSTVLQAASISEINRYAISEEALVNMRLVRGVMSKEREWYAKVCKHSTEIGRTRREAIYLDNKYEWNEVFAVQVKGLHQSVITIELWDDEAGNSRMVGWNDIPLGAFLCNGDESKITVDISDSDGELVGMVEIDISLTMDHPVARDLIGFSRTRDGMLPGGKICIIVEAAELARNALWYVEIHAHGRRLHSTRPVDRRTTRPQWSEFYFDMFTSFADSVIRIEIHEGDNTSHQYGKCRGWNYLALGRLDMSTVSQEEWLDILSMRGTPIGKLKLIFGFEEAEAKVPDELNVKRYLMRRGSLHELEKVEEYTNIPSGLGGDNDDASSLTTDLGDKSREASVIDDGHVGDEVAETEDQMNTGQDNGPHVTIDPNIQFDYEDPSLGSCDTYTSHTQSETDDGNESEDSDYTKRRKKKLEDARLRKQRQAKTGRKGLYDSESDDELPPYVQKSDLKESDLLQD